MNKDFLDAIRSGDATRVTQMIDADPALVNTADENGFAPYTIARYSRQDVIAKLFLERGAKLDICAAALAGDDTRIVELLADDRSLAGNYSHDGWTPLHLAAFFGNQACAEILLANGADVHVRSRNTMQNEPLHAAAAGRHVEVVRVLLAHGADVNARRHGGWTALHAAADNGSVEMAKVLLAHGAIEQSRADNNQTPLDLALTKGHQAMVDLLDEHATGQGA